MYARERSSIAAVMPVARHPENRNSIVVVDLATDIRPLIEWDADRLREVLFGADRDDRPGLKEVRLNRCPFVAPIAVVREEDARRLEFDMVELQRRFEALRATPDLAARSLPFTARRAPAWRATQMPRSMTASCGDPDRQRCGDVLTQLLGGEPAPDIAFADQRLNELLFRLRARRDESALTAPERDRWRTWMRHQLIDGVGGSSRYRCFGKRWPNSMRQPRSSAALCRHARRSNSKLFPTIPARFVDERVSRRVLRSLETLQCGMGAR
jgi:exodeoxyribonuclease-1